MSLEIETVEARAVTNNGEVTGIEKTTKNSATDLIEDFMIASNGSVARVLGAHRVSAIRRIVRSPERWQRIVDLAKQFDVELPQQPDPVALPERSGVQPRTYILVDDTPTAYLEKAVALGATKLWDEGFWDEFNGYHAAFLDPWGNQIVMWQAKDARSEAGEAPGASG